MSWKRLVEVLGLKTEGPVSQVTSRAISSDAIDASGGADRKVSELAQELDAIVDAINRMARDPNYRSNKVDPTKVAKAWSGVIAALRGER